MPSDLKPLGVQCPADGEEKRNLGATKADDAEIPFQLWNDRILSPQRSITLEQKKYSTELCSDFCSLVVVKENHEGVLDLVQEQIPRLLSKA